LAPSRVASRGAGPLKENLMKVSAKDDVREAALRELASLLDTRDE
jgi:hypothetical protein